MKGKSNKRKSIKESNSHQDLDIVISIWRKVEDFKMNFKAKCGSENNTVDCFVII